ncbi:acetylornithine aminotransferase [Gracilibacillus halophilus YIM-C55.5]|uniref:Acetylornithine aminotransferase n=1 Tax=Gracilibacillus halophilus YIM-C55.5 TaxID=1308866 RepID=N4W7V1_9BACI|nr:aspartate aminotransferase family protein [Gracilibacillus halophilus]ENH96348.1 acetylornithine aminotransferase [Gracilibacillus halophilus YIM-C55.5]
MANQTLSSAVMGTYNRFPVTLVKGKGSYVWDEEDTKYLDYSSGIATCNLGHVPNAVEEAMNQQLGDLWHCSNLFHIPSQEELAKQLTDNSCGDQVFFCNSGAEANEAAIKLARKYGQDVQQKEQSQIITFTNSFHGRTMATLSATGQEKIQQGFSPLTPGFDYLPFNDDEALNQLEELSPTAVMLELVQGEGGVIPANQQWVERLASICQNQDILLMVDEIQTGMGRTGTLFAYQQYGIEPDVISLAKGLGSGFPIGAIIAKQDVANVFSAGAHGSTFGGNPLATTAGLATVRELTETPVVTESKKIASYLWQELESLKEESTIIQDVRGMGLLLGVELNQPAIDIVHKARNEHQLLIIVAGPNVLRILPPLTTTFDEAKQFISVMKQLLT